MSVVSTLHWTGWGEHVASIVDIASPGTKDGSPSRLDETPTMASPSPREAAISDPGSALDARRTRSEGSLRRQLFFSDLAAVSLAWGIPMLFQSRTSR
jgi:hypothetical protein